MEFKKLMTTAALFAAVSFGSTTASAEQLALTNLTTMMLPGTLQTSCETCHTSSTGAGGSLNSFGDDWLAAGGGKAAYTLTDAASTALGAVDSDGDGDSNDVELDAGTNPGEAPAAATTTTAASSSSGGGCIASSVTTPLTMVLAMLTLGFFVRRKKD